MNIETALYFLDTNSKVSCPEITAQQAKELADLLREMERTEKRHAREWSELLGERDEWHFREAEMERSIEYWRSQADVARENVVKLRTELAAQKEQDRGPQTLVTSDVEVDASDYERPGRGKK